jgi:hypothetical protein
MHNVAIFPVMCRNATYNLDIFAFAVVVKPTSDEAHIIRQGCIEHCKGNAYTHTVTIKRDCSEAFDHKQAIQGI